MTTRKVQSICIETTAENELVYNANENVVKVKNHSVNRYPLQYHRIQSSHTSDGCLHYNSFLATCNYADMTPTDFVPNVYIKTGISA